MNKVLQKISLVVLVLMSLVFLSACGQSVDVDLGDEQPQEFDEAQDAEIESQVDSLYVDESDDFELEEVV